MPAEQFKVRYSILNRFKRMDERILRVIDLSKIARIHYKTPDYRNGTTKPGNQVPGF